jgi:hypothetical protein
MGRKGMYRPTFLYPHFIHILWLRSSLLKTASKFLSSAPVVALPSTTRQVRALGDGPEKICCIRLEIEIEVPVMVLLDLVGGKQQRAGCRHALMSAFIVTLYDVGSDVLGAPGSRLGTITRRDKHLGLSQLDTTRVLRQKDSSTTCVAGFP